MSPVTGDPLSAMIIPVFLPHLGCRDRCIYCDQDTITDIGQEELRGRIAQSLSHRKGPFEVGLYGGNIFGIEPKALRRLFSCFEVYRDNIANFRISTKPVPLDREIIGILKENRVTTIELGIPSFNDRILAALNRRHTADDLRLAFARLSAEGFQVALQVMVGLPNETKEDIRETAEQVIQLSSCYLRIYPLVFLRETPLGRMAEAHQFTTISFEEAVKRTLFIYLTALRHGIRTVKMGLTDNEVIKERIIGGFYHPAFGFLVKSAAFYRAVRATIVQGGLKGEVFVSLNDRDVPHLVGHKRSNLIEFQKAGLSITLERADIPPGAFVVRSHGSEAAGTIFDALSQLEKADGFGSS